MSWEKTLETSYSTTCRDGCKQHTAPRASITCHTRSFSRRVDVAQDDREIPAPCLTHRCLHKSPRPFLHLRLVRPTSFAVFPVDKSIHCHSAGMYPNSKAYMNSLKRKLIKPFKKNLRLRQDYLKRRLNWTEESGECKMLILLS